MGATLEHSIQVGLSDHPVASPQICHGNIRAVLGRWPVGISSPARKLPEPIDLELDTKNNLLYWTDRGNLDGGNSLNRACIGTKQLENHEVLATGLQEGIGLAIDHANQRASTTELGGEVRVASLEVNAQFTTIAKLGILTGIAYVA